MTFLGLTGFLTLTDLALKAEIESRDEGEFPWKLEKRDGSRFTRATMRACPSAF